MIILVGNKTLYHTRLYFINICHFLLDLKMGNQNQSITSSPKKSDKPKRDSLKDNYEEEYNKTYS